MADADSKAAQLRALRSDPAAQAEYAASLIRTRQARDLLFAALDVLAAHPVPGAKASLLALYESFRSSGPARDPGTFTRRAILSALRPLAVPSDLPLFLDAVATYEYLPPDFREDAILLRASALVILNELDDALARYHGARLLVDPHTDRMSGEPALSAARVLASQGELVSLYQYAMQPADRTLPEVTSECLRSLVGMPAALIPGLLEHFAENHEAMVLVGLFDLLIGFRKDEGVVDHLADRLATTRDLDAYRYLVMSLITSGDQVLVDLLLAAARRERNPDRVAVLLEALDLLGPSSSVDAARRYLEDLG